MLIALTRRGFVPYGIPSCASLIIASISMGMTPEADQRTEAYSLTLATAEEHLPVRFHNSAPS